MTVPSSVVALIPAWNTAVRIAPVVQGATVHLPVLVVDDGSRDETAAAAQAAGTSIVRHPKNRSKGAGSRPAFPQRPSVALGRY